jgi:hypothetical protein
MLSLYFGNDVVAARKGAMSRAGSLIDECGARLNRIESENWAPGMLSDMLGATSLFGGIEIYIIDTPSERVDFYVDVMRVLAEMGESGNHFIVIEGVLLAPEKKKFEKHAATMEEFKKVAATSFDVWAMADALVRRDKKSLWVLLQDAKRAGLSAEELMGTLWWQLKTLRLASLTNNATEAGMKDFPYSKAKRALSVFKSGEIDNLCKGLLRVYHEGHGGVKDTDIGLEEWVLRG